MKSKKRVSDCESRVRLRETNILFNDMYIICTGNKYQYRHLPFVNVKRMLLAIFC